MALYANFFFISTQVLYSIDGCVRNFHMTESPVNLNNPTSSYNVGRCFANAQEGTYFDGTGFAKTGNTSLFIILKLEYMGIF